MRKDLVKRSGEQETGRPRNLWLFALVAWLVGGCSETATRIVVIIEPDPSIAAQLERVEVSMRREGVAQEFDAGVYPIPRFALTPPGSNGHVELRPRDLADGRRVFITIDGFLRDGARVRHTTLTQFQRGKTLYLQVPLLSSCARVGCTGMETCVEGRCEIVAFRPLPEAPSPGRLDATLPALDERFFDDKTVADQNLSDDQTSGADVQVEAAVDVLRDGGLPDRSDMSDRTDTSTVDGQDIDGETVVPSDTAEDVAIDIGRETVEGSDVPDGATIDQSDALNDVFDVTDTSSTLDVVGFDVNPSMITAPRAISPLSATRVWRQQPELQWELPAGTDGTRVEVCRDRACGMVVYSATVPLAGVSRRIRWIYDGSALTAGVYYWRLAGMSSGVTGTRFSPSWAFRVGFRSALRQGSSIAEPDFDGNGYDDLAVTNGAQPAVVYPGSAAALNASVLRTLAATDSISVAGDVNGDGYVELVMAVRSGVILYWGGSDFPERTQMLPALPEPGLAVVGHGVDFDGDGYSDIVASTGDHVYILYGAPSVAALTSGTWLQIAGSNYNTDGVGDVNGDGYGDVAIVNEIVWGGPRGSSSIFRSSIRAEGGWYLSGQSDAAGDVDGDGFADVICSAQTAPGGGGVHTECVYFGHADGASDRVVCLRAHAASRAAAGTGGDFDGDGFDDVLMFTQSNAVVGEFRRGGGSLTTLADYQFLGDSSGGAYVSVGDFNGDGRLDAAFATDAGVFVYYGRVLSANVPTPDITLNPPRNGYRTLVRGEDNGTSSRVQITLAK